MLINYKNLRIRNATVKDSHLLALWWNDGKIMAHAGFPYGTGETAENIAERLKQDSDDTGRRLIIEDEGVAIGEMNYRNVGNSVAEIGIKICDFSKQNRGYGKLLLSMLIKELFSMGYKKIILDTNIKNIRAQHVYEKLGFRKVRINVDAWKDQLGESQTSIDYILVKENFVDFTL